MKAKFIIVPLAMLVALVAVGVNAAAAGTPDARGGCQRMLDADNDGIPNGLDADYVPPRDGTGNQFGKLRATPAGSFTFTHRWNWHMPSLFGAWISYVGGLTGSGYGPGDGTGYDGDGPADGTGYGPGPYGPGACRGVVR